MYRKLSAFTDLSLTLGFCMKLTMVDVSTFNMKILVLYILTCDTEDVF